MVIQNLTIPVLRATWAIGESDRDRDTSEEWLSVRKLGWFEEDRLFVIDLSDGLVGAHMDWVEDGTIELGRMEEEARVVVEVGTPGFVEDVIANDVGVGAHLRSNDCPEVHHLVE